MDFVSYIKSIPNQRNETLDILAEKCKVSKSTAYRWVKGEVIPDALKRNVISTYLGISEEELWPTINQG